jgi:hypothetical protein
MLRILAASAAACIVLAEWGWPREVAAQAWDDARARALVELATARRVQQLADTGLADYKASAHGYLTFLAQVGEGFTEPPKIVKADELALEVYWLAPNLSKQRIVGRRDTLLLPTDINYHRDHLGIVQNNFPSIIRLGDGDEVRDVPHPLSPEGLRDYQFAITDSLRISLLDRTIDVYEVRVRPVDDRQPRAIGAVFLERESAQVVRMAFSFTRAAYLDALLEDVSIVLENGLIDGRFWLPRQQEIEIRRTGKWLDFPARGIIRGRWEICCHEVNTGLRASFFGGPEIVQAAPRVVAAHRWAGRILDSLPPDVRAVTPEEVRRVQTEARAVVRGQALARARTTALAARGISDFARVTRVEGFAFGAGLSHRLGGGVTVGLAGRWGTSDHEAKGRLTLGWQRASGAGVRLFAERAYREVGDERETSALRNSIAAQEFGSDYTDPYDVRGAGLSLDFGQRLGVRWRLDGAYETHDPLSVHARPATGSYEPTVPAWSIAATRAALIVSRPTAMSVFGSELQATLEVRGSALEARETALPTRRPLIGRASLLARAERPVGAHRLVFHTVTAVVGGAREIPPQELVFLGGPVTGPGYEFHQFASRFGVSQRVEWQSKVPFVGFPIGRFGRAPSTATLAPFAHLVYVTDGATIRAPTHGFYPAVGVGLLTIFDVIRLEVARGLRQGRWTFSADVTRDFWGIL